MPPSAESPFFHRYETGVLQKCSTPFSLSKKAARKEIPSPGEKVARPNEVRKSGSEEECGQRTNDLYNAKAC